MLNDAAFLGNLNLFLLFWVIFFVIYKQIFKKNLSKKPGTLYRNIYKTLKRIHPIFATATIFIGIYHGILMLGSLRLHTGSLIILAITFMLITFLLGKTKILRKDWKKFHKAGGVVVVSTVFIHLYFPYLI